MRGKNEKIKEGEMREYERGRQSSLSLSQTYRRKRKERGKVDCKKNAGNERLKERKKERNAKCALSYLLFVLNGEGEKLPDFFLFLFSLSLSSFFFPSLFPLSFFLFLSVLSFFFLSSLFTKIPPLCSVLSSSVPNAKAAVHTHTFVLYLNQQSKF